MISEMTLRSNVIAAFAVLALAVTVSARQQSVPPPTTIAVPTLPTFPTLPTRSNGFGTRDPLTAIIGQVTDSNGRPVPQAAVRLVADRVIETVLTDPKGRFAFTTIPPGEMVVTAEKYGYYAGGYGQRRATGLPLPFSLPYGRSISDMKIEVYRGSTLTGAVRDEAGEPIIGAKVLASRRQFVEGEWQYMAVAAEDSDDQGMFRIFNLLPGEYIVSVGTMPVAINQQGDKQLQDRERPTMFPRMYFPQAPDRTLALPVQLTAGEVRYGVNFMLPPVTTRRVTGRLFGAPDATTRQTVRLVPIDASWATDETARTLSENDGSFVFEDVPEGRYRIQAGNVIPKMSGASDPNALAAAIEAARSYCGQIELTVRDGDVRNADVDMVQAAVVSAIVEVHRDGNPNAAVLRSIPISLEPAGPGLSRAVQTNVAPGGAFAFSDLIPGSYFVRVGSLPTGWAVQSIEGDGDAFDHPIDLKNADAKIAIAVADHGTQLIGTVRDNRMQAASGAAVIILPAGMTPDAWQPNRIRQTRTSTSGVFTIHGLPPGNYVVVAIDEASAEGWQDERMVTRLASLGTRFTLHSLETLSLVVQITR
jgi:hypothetical protein